jgi:hypothetical protein
MQTDLSVLRTNSVKAIFPPPSYAFDAFDHGVNRKVVAQDPRHAVFHVGPFGNLQPGDVLYLFFGDDLVPVAEMTLPGGPVGVLEVHAPASQILRYVADNQARRIDVWYAIIRPLEGLESERLTAYLVDFQPPGGIPVFGDPSYVNTKLRPIPELEGDIPQGQPLVMNVPPWENMSLGDRLFVRWGSENLGPFEVTTVGQIGQPVEVVVPWEIITGTDGGVASVDYYITDTVNNHSYYAAAKVIDAGVPLLPKPILPDHMNGIINLDTLGTRDVAVLVAFTGMRETDQIKLIVDRVSGDGVTLPQYTQMIPGTTNGSVRSDIPNAIIRAIPRGEARIRYEVSRIPLLRSDVTTARVEGTGASLEAADTPDFPNHQVDVSQLPPNGLLVTVPRYPFLQDLDRITITSTFTHAGATYTDTQTRFGSDFGGGMVLSIRVPRDKIVPAAGGTGSIAYSVTPQGAVSIPAPSRPLAIIGTVPGDWDLEYNFDLDRLRYIQPRQTIRFPETGPLVMDMYFDPDMHTDPDEQLGVERYQFTPSDDFFGNVLYVGNPQWTSHNNVFFVNLGQSWDVVRFAVTSVHREVTVSFKDASLNVISGIITIPDGDPGREVEVIYDDKRRGRIRHMEIRAKDVIRIDSFKFRH